MRVDRAVERRWYLRAKPSYDPHCSCSKKLGVWVGQSCRSSGSGSGSGFGSADHKLSCQSRCGTRLRSLRSLSCALSALSLVCSDQGSGMEATSGCRLLCLTLQMAVIGAVSGPLQSAALRLECWSLHQGLQ